MKRSHRRAGKDNSATLTACPPGQAEDTHALPDRGPASNCRITRYQVTTPIPPSCTLTASVNHQLRGITQVRAHTYEITFSGEAGRTLRAQFDECTVTTGPDTTTLRAELPDQAALSGLVQRIVGLGLEVIDVHIVTAPDMA